MMLIHVKKILSGVLVLVFLTAMLAACSGEAGQSGTDSIGGPSSEVDPGEESAAPEGNDGELNYQGTISIYAQQYTPCLLYTSPSCFLSRYFRFISA